MNKQFFVVVLVIVAGLVGVFALTKESSPGSQNGSGDQTVQATDHKVGAGNKKVTLTEYGDFQCPACKAYYPIVKEIKATYGDDITFQFRNFPLTQIHPNAMIGHRAAEAAGKQGKFFEMHDVLYEKQDDWSRANDPSAILVTYAKLLGLNEEQFKTDMTSKATADAINADIKAGQSFQATSTPTFVLNDKKIEENPRSFEDFKKLIDAKIAELNQ